VIAGAAVAALAGALVLLRAPTAYSPWLLAAGPALLLGGCAALRLRRRAAGASAAVVSLASLLAAQLALSGTHMLDGNFSSERLIEQVVGERLQFPRTPPFYSVATYDHSVPFYLGRPVTLVAHKDELAPGIAAEPSKYVDSVDEFVARWNRDAEAFAIMSPDVYDKLRGQGLPGRVVVRDEHRVLISRH